MKKLYISIEMEGRQREVGSISGESGYDAVFSYSEDYLSAADARPISISLPLSENHYSPSQTRNFFEGLLPEGFLRRKIAENNRSDSGDYLSLLEMLGSECLGAVRIMAEDYKSPEPSYSPLDDEMMYRLAAEGATRSADLVVRAHLSLTGASGKIGAYRDKDGKWYLPVGSAPSTHILKQSHIRYNNIAQNEQLALRTAEIMGIEIPRSEILGSEGAHAGLHGLAVTGVTAVTEDILFATERYDRTLIGSVKTVSGLPCPLRLHQEDMGQALMISASDKYERPGDAHMKKMFDLLRRYSASPVEDQMKLWDIIVYHWLVGNTDGHIKNISLIYDRQLRSVRLAPAYDIVSTIVYDSHSTEMAFSVGGEIERDKIDRRCFEEACKESGLYKKLFMERFDRMRELFRPSLMTAAEIMKDEGYDTAIALAETILQRSNSCMVPVTVSCN